MFSLFLCLIATSLGTATAWRTVPAPRAFLEPTANTSTRSGGQCACSAGVRIVACTMVKNEMGYLPEWIAYHRAIGIQKFVIYDDNSSDGVGSLAELYSARNEAVDVEVRPALRNPEGSFQTQETSFTDCVKRNQNATWVGVFDVDEFVVLKSRPEEPCSAEDSLKCLLNGVQEGQVHFSEVRFSTARQTKDSDIRFRGAHSSKPMSAMTMPTVDKEKVTQALDCFGLGLSEDSVTVEGTPTLIMGTINSQAVQLNSTRQIPTLTQGHVWRQPLPGTAEDKDYEAQKVAACTDPKLEAAALWNVCKPGLGKSFVKPGQCSAYAVHSISLPCGDTLPSKQFGFEAAQLNHYYLRSAEGACKKAVRWGKPDPVVMYQTVDASYMHSVEDRSASVLVPGVALQQHLEKLFVE